MELIQTCKFASPSGMPRGSDPNRCRRSEIEDLRPLAQQRARRSSSGSGQAPPPSPPANRIRPERPPRDDDDESRLFDNEAKVDMFQRYSEWVVGGKKREDSPIDDLVEEYGCHRTYPKRVYDKVIKHGSTSNN